MKRIFKQNIKKFIASLTATSLLISFVAGPAAASAINNEQTTKEYNQIFKEFILPYSYGKVTSAHYAGTDRVIINIQDLHCHPKVQKNISNIIESFDKKFGVNKIYLEGAYGDVSTKWIADKAEDNKQLIDKMLDTGRLTGAEYYSALSGKTEIIKGLEEKGPYLDNIKRLGNILQSQDEVNLILQALDENLLKVKKKYYTKRQYKLEKLFEEYKNGKITSQKYYTLLSKYIDKLGIDLTKYENSLIYITLLELQKKLNYKQTTKELQDLILLIKQQLPYSIYKSLLENTSNFTELEKLYSYIIQLDKGYNFDITSNFKELDKYFRYIELSKKINPVELVKEDEFLLQEINTRFSQTKAQQDIVFLIHFQNYLKDFITTKITLDDYNYYKENIDKYRQIYNKYVDNRVLSLLDENIKQIDKFYEINMDRNSYFAKNMFNENEFLNKIDSEVTTAKDDINKIMDNIKGVKEIDIVVTGGFHSQTVTEIIKNHDVSYIVITPNVTDGIKLAEDTYYELAKEQSKISFQTIAPVIASLSPKIQELLLEKIGNVENIEEVMSLDDNKRAEVISELAAAKLLESDDVGAVKEKIEEIINDVLNETGDKEKVTYELISRIKNLQAVLKDKEKLENVISLLQEGTVKQSVMLVSIMFDKLYEQLFDTFVVFSDKEKLSQPEIKDFDTDRISGEDDGIENEGFEKEGSYEGYEEYEEIYDDDLDLWFSDPDIIRVSREILSAGNKNKDIEKFIRYLSEYNMPDYELLKAILAGLNALNNDKEIGNFCGVIYSLTDKSTNKSSKEKASKTKENIISFLEKPESVQSDFRKLFSKLFVGHEDKRDNFFSALLDFVNKNEYTDKDFNFLLRVCKYSNLISDLGTKENIYDFLTLDIEKRRLLYNFYQAPKRHTNIDINQLTLNLMLSVLHKYDFTDEDFNYVMKLICSANITNNDVEKEYVNALKGKEINSFVLENFKYINFDSKYLLDLLFSEVEEQYTENFVSKMQKIIDMFDELQQYRIDTLETENKCLALSVFLNDRFEKHCKDNNINDLVKQYQLAIRVSRKMYSILENKIFTISGDKVDDLITETLEYYKKIDKIIALLTLFTKKTAIFSLHHNERNSRNNSFRFTPDGIKEILKKLEIEPEVFEAIEISFMDKVFDFIKTFKQDEIDKQTLFDFVNNLEGSVVIKKDILDYLSKKTESTISKKRINRYINRLKITERFVEVNRILNHIEHFNDYGQEKGVFILDGHGAPNGQSISYSQTGSISVSQITQALIKAHNNGVNLENLTFVFSSCHSYKFADNIINELVKNGITVFPQIITDAGKETAYAYTTNVNLEGKPAKVSNLFYSLMKYLDTKTPEQLQQMKGRLTFKDLVDAPRYLSNNTAFVTNKQIDELNRSLEEKFRDIVKEDIDNADSEIYIAAAKSPYAELMSVSTRERLDNWGETKLVKRIFKERSGKNFKYTPVGLIAGVLMETFSLWKIFSINIRIFGKEIKVKNFMEDHENPTIGQEIVVWVIRALSIGLGFGFGTGLGSWLLAAFLTETITHFIWNYFVVKIGRKDLLLQTSQKESQIEKTTTPEQQQSVSQQKWTMSNISKEAPYTAKYKLVYYIFEKTCRQLDIEFPEEQEFVIINNIIEAYDSSAWKILDFETWVYDRLITDIIDFQQKQSRLMYVLNKCVPGDIKDILWIFSQCLSKSKRPMFILSNIIDVAEELEKTNHISFSEEVYSVLNILKRYNTSEAEQIFVNMGLIKVPHALYKKAMNDREFEQLESEILENENENMTVSSELQLPSTQVQTSENITKKQTIANILSNIAGDYFDDDEEWLELETLLNNDKIHERDLSFISENTTFFTDNPTVNYEKIKFFFTAILSLRHKNLNIDDDVYEEIIFLIDIMTKVDDSLLTEIPDMDEDLLLRFHNLRQESKESFYINLRGSVKPNTFELMLRAAEEAEKFSCSEDEIGDILTLIFKNQSLMETYYFEDLKDKTLNISNLRFFSYHQNRPMNSKDFGNIIAFTKRKQNLKAANPLWLSVLYSSVDLNSLVGNDDKSLDNLIDLMNALNKAKIRMLDTEYDGLALRIFLNSKFKTSMEGRRATPLSMYRVAQKISQTLYNAMGDKVLNLENKNLDSIIERLISDNLERRSIARKTSLVSEMTGVIAIHNSEQYEGQARYSLKGIETVMRLMGITPKLKTDLVVEDTNDAEDKAEEWLLYIENFLDILKQKGLKNIRYVFDGHSDDDKLYLNGKNGVSITAEQLAEALFNAYKKCHEQGEGEKFEDLILDLSCCCSYNFAKKVINRLKELELKQTEFHDLPLRFPQIVTEAGKETKIGYSTWYTDDTTGEKFLVSNMEYSLIQYIKNAKEKNQTISNITLQDLFDAQIYKANHTIFISNAEIEKCNREIRQYLAETLGGDFVLSEQDDGLPEDILPIRISELMSTSTRERLDNWGETKLVKRIFKDRSGKNFKYTTAGIITGVLMETLSFWKIFSINIKIFGKEIKVKNFIEEHENPTMGQKIVVWVIRMLSVGLGFGFGVASFGSGILALFLAETITHFIWNYFVVKIGRKDLLLQTSEQTQSKETMQVTVPSVKAKEKAKELTKEQQQRLKDALSRTKARIKNSTLEITDENDKNLVLELQGVFNSLLDSMVKLGRITESEKKDYELVLYLSDELNAFTVSGSKTVFISTGMLYSFSLYLQGIVTTNGEVRSKRDLDLFGYTQYMNKQIKDLSKDHIAAILAHELEHTIQDKGVYSSSLSTKGDQKKDEYDSDIQAIFMLDKAGYNPTIVQELMEFLVFLEQKEKDNILCSILDAHPDAENRLIKIKTFLADRNIFLRGVDNTLKKLESSIPHYGEDKLWGDIIGKLGYAKRGVGPRDSQGFIKEILQKYSGKISLYKILNMFNRIERFVDVDDVLTFINDNNYPFFNDKIKSFSNEQKKVIIRLMNSFDGHYPSNAELYELCPDMDALKEVFDFMIEPENCYFFFEKISFLKLSHLVAALHNSGKLGEKDYDKIKDFLAINEDSFWGKSTFFVEIDKDTVDFYVDKFDLFDNGKKYDLYFKFRDILSKENNFSENQKGKLRNFFFTPDMGAEAGYHMFGSVEFFELLYPETTFESYVNSVTEERKQKILEEAEQKEIEQYNSFKESRNREILGDAYQKEKDPDITSMYEIYKHSGFAYKKFEKEGNKWDGDEKYKKWVSEHDEALFAEWLQNQKDEWFHDTCLKEYKSWLFDRYETELMSKISTLEEKLKLLFPGGLIEVDSRFSSRLDYGKSIPKILKREIENINSAEELFNLINDVISYFYKENLIQRGDLNKTIYNILLNVDRSVINNFTIKDIQKLFEISLEKGMSTVTYLSVVALVSKRKNTKSELEFDKIFSVCDYHSEEHKKAVSDFVQNVMDREQLEFLLKICYEKDLALKDILIFDVCDKIAEEFDETLSLEEQYRYSIYKDNVYPYKFYQKIKNEEDLKKIPIEHLKRFLGLEIVGGHSAGRLGINNSTALRIWQNRVEQYQKKFGESFYDTKSFNEFAEKIKEIEEVFYPWKNQSAGNQNVIFSNEVDMLWANLLHNMCGFGLDTKSFVFINIHEEELLNVWCELTPNYDFIPTAQQVNELLNAFVLIKNYLPKEQAVVYARMLYEMIRKNENLSVFESAENNLELLDFLFEGFSEIKDDYIYELLENYDINIDVYNECLSRTTFYSYQDDTEDTNKNFLYRELASSSSRKEMDVEDRIKLIAWLISDKQDKPSFLKNISVQNGYDYNAKSIYLGEDARVEILRNYFWSMTKSERTEYIRELISDILKEGVNEKNYETLKNSLADVFFESIRTEENEKIIDALKESFKIIFDSLSSFEKRSTSERQILFINDLIESLTSISESDFSPEEQEARQIGRFIVAMGAASGVAVVKILQILSNNKAFEGLGKQGKIINEEISKVRSSNEKLSKRVVFQELENLGILDDVESVGKCLGSASIGITYFLNMKDGSRKIIKIKRPSIIKNYEQDLQIAENLIHYFKTSNVLPKSNRNMIPTINFLKQVFDTELNFKDEAGNMVRAKSNLEQTSIYVPNVVGNYNRDSFIQSLAQGRSLDNSQTLFSEQERGEIYSKILLEFFREAFKDGFFHADLHEGNIFVDKNKHITFIDWGACGSVEENKKESLEAVFISLLLSDSNSFITNLKEYDINLYKKLESKIGSISEVLDSKDTLENKLGKIFAIFNQIDMSENHDFLMFIQAVSKIAKYIDNLSVKEKILLLLDDTVLYDLLQNKQILSNVIPEKYRRIVSVVINRLIKLKGEKLQNIIDNIRQFVTNPEEKNFDTLIHDIVLTLNIPKVFESPLNKFVSKNLNKIRNGQIQSKEQNLTEQKTNVFANIFGFIKIFFNKDKKLRIKFNEYELPIIIMIKKEGKDYSLMFSPDSGRIYLHSDGDKSYKYNSSEYKTVESIEKFLGIKLKIYKHRLVIKDKSSKTHMSFVRYTGLKDVVDSFEKKPVSKPEQEEIDLLKKHSGCTKVEYVYLSQDKDIQADNRDKIENAIREHKLIVLYPLSNAYDINDLTDEQEICALYLQVLTNFTDMVDTLFPQDALPKLRKTDFKGMEHLLFELVKNAFIHGNLGDTSKPIYIDCEKEKFTVYNVHSDSESTSERLLNISAMVGLSGTNTGMGIIQQYVDENLITVTPQQERTKQLDKHYVVTIDRVNKEFDRPVGWVGRSFDSGFGSFLDDEYDNPFRPDLDEEFAELFGDDGILLGGDDILGDEDESENSLGDKETSQEQTDSAQETVTSVAKGMLKKTLSVLSPDSVSKHIFESDRGMTSHLAALSQVGSQLSVQETTETIAETENTRTKINFNSLMERVFGIIDSVEDMNNSDSKNRAKSMTEAEKKLTDTFTPEELEIIDLLASTIFDSIKYVNATRTTSAVEFVNIIYALRDGNALQVGLFNENLFPKNGQDLKQHISDMLKHYVEVSKTNKQKKGEDDILYKAVNDNENILEDMATFLTDIIVNNNLIEKSKQLREQRKQNMRKFIDGVRKDDTAYSVVMVCSANENRSAIWHIMFEDFLKRTKRKMAKVLSAGVFYDISQDELKKKGKTKDLRDDYIKTLSSDERYKGIDESIKSGFRSRYIEYLRLPKNHQSVFIVAGEQHRAQLIKLGYDPNWIFLMTEFYSDDFKTSFKQTHESLGKQLEENNIFSMSEFPDPFEEQILRQDLPELVRSLVEYVFKTRDDVVRENLPERFAIYTDDYNQFKHMENLPFLTSDGGYEEKRQRELMENMREFYEEEISDLVREKYQFEFRANTKYLYILQNRNNKNALLDIVSREDAGLKFKLFALMYLNIMQRGMTQEELDAMNIAKEKVLAEFEKQLENNSFSVSNNFDLRSYMMGVYLMLQDYFKFQNYSQYDLDVIYKAFIINTDGKVLANSHGYFAEVDLFIAIHELAHVVIKKSKHFDSSEIVEELVSYIVPNIFLSIAKLSSKSYSKLQNRYKMHQTKGAIDYIKMGVKLNVLYNLFSNKVSDRGIKQEEHKASIAFLELLFKAHNKIGKNVDWKELLEAVRMIEEEQFNQSYMFWMVLDNYTESLVINGTLSKQEANNLKKEIEKMQLWTLLTYDIVQNIKNTAPDTYTKIVGFEDESKFEKELLSNPAEAKEQLKRISDKIKTKEQLSKNDILTLLIIDVISNVDYEQLTDNFDGVIEGIMNTIKGATEMFDMQKDTYSIFEYEQISRFAVDNYAVVMNPTTNVMENIFDFVSNSLNKFFFARTLLNKVFGIKDINSIMKEKKLLIVTSKQQEENLRERMEQDEQTRKALNLENMEIVTMEIITQPTDGLRSDMVLDVQKGIRASYKDNKLTIYSKQGIDISTEEIQSLIMQEYFAERSEDIITDDVIAFAKTSDVTLEDISNRLKTAYTASVKMPNKENDFDLSSKEITDLIAACNQEFIATGIKSFVITQKQAEKFADEIKILKEKDFRFIISCDSDKIVDITDYDGLVINAGAIPNINQARSFMESIKKKVLTQGLAKQISIKFNDDVYKQFETIGMDIFNYYGVMPIVSADKIWKIGRCKVEKITENNIDKLLRSNNVIGFVIDNARVFVGKKGILKQLFSKEHKYNKGYNASLSSKFNYVCSDVSLLAKYLDVDINGNLKKQLEDITALFSNKEILDADLLKLKSSLSPDSLTYLEYLKDEGKYEEMAGFIRGMAMNSARVQIIDGLNKKGINLDMDKFAKEAGGKYQKAFLTVAVQLMMENVDITTLLETDFIDSDMTAKQYFDSVYEKVNINIESILKQNEFKIKKIEKENIPKTIEDFKNYVVLLDNLKIIKESTVSFDTSMKAVRSMLSAA